MLLNLNLNRLRSYRGLWKKNLYLILIIYTIAFNQLCSINLREN